LILKYGITDKKEADFNLNGQVNDFDRNDLWLPNKGTGMQIP
jgi:hypothetical protein